MKKLVAFSIISVLFISCLMSLSMDESLEQLSKEAAKSYINPLVSPLGSNVNGGWFTHAPKGKILALDIGVKLVYMGTFFADDAKEFSKTADYQFSRAQATAILNNTQGLGGIPVTHKDAIIDYIVATPFTTTISGPTIIGSSSDSIMVVSNAEPVTINIGNNEYDYTLSPYVIGTSVKGLLSDLSSLSVLTPQVTIGTLVGTNLILRYAPPFEISKKLGEFSCLGIGVQHNPKVWMNLLSKIIIPVDISFSIFGQQMKLGEFIDASAYSVGANVSKTIGLSFFNITPYGGLFAEGSKLNVKYDFQIDDTGNVPPIKIDFESKGENTFRGLVGVNLHLGLIDLNADYNISKFSSFTAGLGASIKF